MNPRVEIKHLESLVKLQERTDLPFIFKPIFMPIMWGVCGVSIVACKKAYEAGAMHPYLFISILIVIGVAIGFHSVYKASYKAWPVISPYLDTERVKARIAELKK